VPDAHHISATLNKLNIYGAGGHFAPHKDTPVNADTCFGSLVVGAYTRTLFGSTQATFWSMSRFVSSV